MAPQQDTPATPATALAKLGITASQNPWHRRTRLVQRAVTRQAAQLARCAMATARQGACGCTCGSRCGSLFGCVAVCSVGVRVDVDVCSWSALVPQVLLPDPIY